LSATTGSPDGSGLTRATILAGDLRLGQAALAGYAVSR